MASNLALGHYVAQVFTFEDDDIRLLQLIQQHGATGQAMSGAVYKAFFSSHPPAIERRAVIAANSTWHASDLDHRNAMTGDAEHSLRGDLTLTLLSIDATWRFDDFNRRLYSPTLAWPAMRKLYKPGSSLEADLILQIQSCQSPGSLGGASVSPPAHILHVEITRSPSSDAVVEKIASRLRENLPSSSRQLLFISDPAQDHAPHKGVGKHVLMQEFDALHTAGMIAANVDSTMLRKLSDEYGTDAVVRIFSLAGSATYHNVTPNEPEALKINIHTHAEKFAKPAPPDQELYFGLRPEQYVQI